MLYKTDYNTLKQKTKEKALGLLLNRNSSPPYRWATPFTLLKRENSLGEF